MKVLGFLEFYNFVQNCSYEDLISYEKLFGWKYNQYESLTNLKSRMLLEYSLKLSQPFKPKLITELFKGWVKRRDEDEYTDKYEDEGKINYIGISEEWVTYDSIENGFTISYPITLDNFRTDCQRVGIELNWRI